MKVLWISPNGGNYKNYSVSGTGGWIGALQNEILKRVPDLELGISFLHATDSEVIQDGRVTYLPVPYTNGNNAFLRLLHNFFSSTKKDEQYVSTELRKVIDKFQPDLIHVWGIEGLYASVIPFIKCPFVVHIQGLSSLYSYKHLPHGYSVMDLRKLDFPLRLILHKGSYQIYKNIALSVAREKRISKYIDNWIGRTDFDKTAANLLHPGSHYYHCEEIMRDGFYGKQWNYHYNGKTIIIQSSLGPGWLKGLDVVLHTAKLLTDLGINVEWHVYGNNGKDYRSAYTIRKLKINPKEVGVILHGNVSGDIICDSLLKSDVYVHTSYIENSSNAIAEAMILGVPTIAQYVGGNPTMLKDNSGVLVPSNEPYALANAILSMRDKEIAEGFSKRALAVSHERQNTDKTINDLMAIYKSIINSDVDD